MFDKFYYDVESSIRAGYDIYRNAENYNVYVCELGDRLEFNFSDEKSLNVWYD